MDSCYNLIHTLLHPPQNFLNGLLQKDPHKRLAWPQLLYHPFVAKGELGILDMYACANFATDSHHKTSPNVAFLWDSVNYVFLVINVTV